jgi:hypothetical protein
MAITKTPSVGKILVKCAPSTSAYPWYQPGGKITKISGQRIYYKDVDGVERFTHDAAAVCETQAEADELLDFSAAEQNAYDEFLQGVKERDETLWAKLSKKAKAAKDAPAAEKSSVGRVRRTR